MIVLLAAALAESAPRIEVGLEGCRLDRDRWICWDGGVQLGAQVRDLYDRENLDRRRFAQLSEWPTGSFHPARWEGHRGWQSVVSDGERSQISRWFVVGSRAYVFTASGPVEEVESAATRLFEAIHPR